MKPRLLFIITSASLLISCGTAPVPSPTGTPAPAEPPIATATAIPPATTAAPTATATPVPTATPIPTETPLPTTTPTVAPTETSTPLPTATKPPAPTATPKPAQPTPTATAIAAPVSSVVIPPPQVFSFDPGGFMQYLEYAHGKYQLMTKMVGAATRQPGSCLVFNQYRNEIMAIPNFTGAPEPWTAMVAEYNDLRTQAFITVEPIQALCQGGGGTLAEGEDRKIIDFFDRAQNRMYEMLQQAKTLTQ